MSLALPAYAESLPNFFGQSGQFIEYVPKTQAPNVTFRDETGLWRQLSDFKGQALLVNIWATWCTPCIREMPALDRLQEALGGRKFQVIAISIDSVGETAVRPFFRAMGIDDLGRYVDPDRQTIFTDANEPRNDAFALYGLPIIYFVDRQGVLVGYLVGTADWDAAEPRTFIRHLTKWR